MSRDVSAHGREQEYVSNVYRRLDELRGGTRERLARIRRQGASGTHQNRSERDSFATLYEDRLARLESVEDQLVFGRLDLREGSQRYIGRIGLSDAEHTPILTDWRAPAARPFYQATAADPGDVVRRRHVLTKGRVVVGVEDDVLDIESLGEGERAELAGEGALLAALGAHRTGRMRDIVATIQSEQDAIIRSDLDGILVVQGGPGTGKTAVALHRAAYLLYAHRERLARSGVLMVGPSGVFLRYIEKVLPALGETGVVSTTIAGLLPDVVATQREDPQVALVKGRAGMAGVIAAAVRERQRVPSAPTPVRVGSRVLEVLPADVEEAMARARRTRTPHNEARVTFVRSMLRVLARQYAAQIGADLRGEDLDDAVEEIRSARDVRVALNLAWMPLSAQRVLADLYARPELLAKVARAMPPRERALLARERESPWTDSDIPLLDEAAELIGNGVGEARRTSEAAAERAAEVEFARAALSASGAGGGMVSAEALAQRFAPTAPRLTTAERASADRTWTYGHIVVDEAQELSAMAWRSLLRRCPSRSFTVVGDVAQTSSAAGARDWSHVMEPVASGHWRQAELSVNYRTPRSVMDAATRVARSAASIQGRGAGPGDVVSARDEPDALAMGGSVADLGQIIAEERRRRGSLAVIAPAACLARVRELAGVPESLDLTSEVVVLDPTTSKGLEFDVVVVVDGSDMSAGDVFVAMTRPTHRLRLVGQLPPGLDTD